MDINEAVIKHFERVQIEKGTEEAIGDLFRQMLNVEIEDCKMIERLYGDILFSASQKQTYIVK